MLLVMAIGQRAGHFSPTRLTLAGVAIGALCSSATSYLQIKADPQQLQGVLFWLLGTVAGAEWPDLGLPAAAVAATTLWLLLRARPMNALLMGDESATALGVDVNRFRLDRCRLRRRSGAAGARRFDVHSGGPAAPRPCYGGPPRCDTRSAPRSWPRSAGR